MTFDSRKSQHSQEIVQTVELHLDGCKYATDFMLGARDVELDGATSIPASGIGTAITIAFGNASHFDASAVSEKTYIKIEDEVLEVDVDSASQVTTTGRGMFGTTAAAHSGALDAKLMHKGEADGTCFGFPGSCSSADSWDGVAVRKLLFSHTPLEASKQYFTGLDFDSINRTGPEVKPGESMGSRARVRFRLFDETDTDDQFNPYRDRLAPGGTRFGKLFARHPYFVGREVVFSQGLRDAGTYDAPEYKTARYVIDSANLDNDVLTLSLLDPLILTEDKKAKVPQPSTGTLTAAMTGTPSSFTYDGDDWHYGNNTDKAYVKIDSEIIECTVSGATTLTIDNRGYRSTSKDHSAGATVQKCEIWENTHVIDIITDILTNFTSIKASMIDDYTAIKAKFPTAIIDEAFVPKPTAVSKVINELIQIGDIIFYFDEETEKIVIDYIPETTVQQVSIDDIDQIPTESIKVNRNETEQYTRFTYMFGLADLTKDSDENYEIIHSAINATLEGGRYMGLPNEKKEQKTTMLSNSTDDTLTGISYVSRTIEKSNVIPSIHTFKLDEEHIGSVQSGEIHPGKVINISNRFLQDAKGEYLSELFQIIQINGTLATGYTVKAKKYYQLDPETIDFTVSGTHEMYDLSSEYAPAAGNYVVYIAPDAVIGSTDSTIDAFDTGTQAAGVTFHFIVRGKVMGMGGAGGDGGVAIYPTTEDNGTDGQDGGNAFNATVDCTIDVGSGLIWAGGGGGAGGRSRGDFNAGVWTNVEVGDGGDGGQGYATSQGGTQGEVDFSGANNGPNWFGLPGSDGNQNSGDGAWGEDGLTREGASAGQAGIAIKSNGNTVTIVAGDNDTNIRGRRT